ncbi:MAG TPA: K(+)-transporting ATPase subunit F [Acidobacteriaceae bacterium]|jgi:K+-transporting ATPase KdpF subunit|nr:K(+)-transporting ATPase subunit F [Acidobacteriaceae bacterium]
MNMTTVIVVAITVVLLAYLIVALLFPENF